MMESSCRHERGSGGHSVPGAYLIVTGLLAMLLAHPSSAEDELLVVCQAFLRASAQIDARQ